MSASDPASDSNGFMKSPTKKIASAAAMVTFVFLCFAFVSSHLRAVPALESFHESPLNGRKLRKITTISTESALVTDSSIQTGTDSLSDVSVSTASQDGLERKFIINAISKMSSGVGVINTVAGTGAYGFGGDGRQATIAAMKYVYDVAVDALGNMYITDTSNNRIRMVTKSTGIISTVAGTGASGYSGDEGLATLATLSLPYGVAVDISGNLYIADSGNSCIRMLNKTTGIISTIAGTGVADFSGDGDLAILASLNYPYGVAVDGSGDVYIADTQNSCIRMVTMSTGIITTMAGNAISPGFSGDGKQATSAALSSPRTVTADLYGNIYIADSDNNRIRMVTVSTGIISTVAGTGSYAGSSGDGGVATSAKLNNPCGISVDELGNIYIADTFNNRIRMVTKSTGVISAVAGTGSPGSSGDGGQAILATMNNPWSVAVDASGNIYIADSDNYRLRMFVLPAAPTAAPTPVRIITAKPTSSGIGEIDTVAGGGLTGILGDEQAAISATLNYPYGVAVDAAKNIYIADTENNRIRMVTKSTGVITTVAGTGTAGSTGDGGKATLATLNSPYCVVVDASGNIFIADTLNNVIRVVMKSTGIIERAAGTGVFGDGIGDGGAATSAGLSNPNGVTFDTSENMYIADTLNNRIRMVTTLTGIITTVAGTGSSGFGGDGGPATLAALNSPSGVAVDLSGNIYIVDTGFNRIRMVTKSTGIINTIAGTGSAGSGGDGGLATLAALNSPTGVAVDAVGNVFIADTNSYRIRMIMKGTGIMITVAGTGLYGFSGDGGQAVTAMVSYPHGVAVDASGNMYIADTFNNRIRYSKMPASPTAAPTPFEMISTKPTVASTQGVGVVTTVAGYGSYGSTGDGGPAVSAGLSSPDDVAVDALGNVYIADSGNNRIRLVTKSTGIVTTVAGTGSAGYGGDGGSATSAALSYPRGITLDGSGNMYIADTYNNRIRVVMKGNGIITTVAGIGRVGRSGDGGPAALATLYNPRTVAVDTSRNIYIADSGNNRIRMVTKTTGIITTIAGTGAPGYSGDGGKATLATLNYPYSVVVDTSGNIFIADTYNHRIRVVTGTGIIDTIAGTGSAGSGGDGALATVATVNYPCDVALDASGNLYIADTDNYRIRVVMKNSGIINPVAGAGSYGSTGDGGQAVLATFYNPHGIALDSMGNLYVADSGNNRVRMFILPTVTSKSVAAIRNGKGNGNGDAIPAIL